MSDIGSEIVRLAHEGVRPGAIAARTGAPRWKVYYEVSQARKAGANIPRFSTRGMAQVKRRVPLRVAVREALVPHAAARGLCPIGLAERLLAKIAEDDLVDAVLDDKGGRDGH